MIKGTDLQGKLKYILQSTGREYASSQELKYKQIKKNEIE